MVQKLRTVIQIAQLLPKFVKDDSFKTTWRGCHPSTQTNKQHNLDVNNFCIMLYSEPLSKHKERPGLHTCALWEIRPQLALVESFALLLYIKI